MVYVTPATTTTTTAALASAAAQDVAPLHALACVGVVTRERPQVAALQHVNQLIDAFVYRPQYFTKS
ncbi:hypothetical protein Gpo141_00014546, partial [Globisporangium polare]